MKLLTEILDKKLQYYQEADLRHDNLIAVWQFYCAYSICLAITGKQDTNIKKKNRLISSLILKYDSKNYLKLKGYMKNDMIVIDDALKIIQEIKQEGGFFGDTYLKDMIAINYDDGNIS